jgi:hypothetical protein
MTTLQDFDLKARGVVSLVEDWRNDQSLARQSWKLDDLIEAYLETIATAIQLFDHFRQHGEFPSRLAHLPTFSHFVALLDVTVRGARALETIGDTFIQQGQSVCGLSTLRTEAAALAEIVAEDQWAFEAAVRCGRVADQD